MALPQKKDEISESPPQEKANIFSLGFLKKTAASVTKDAFDFCFESIEEKSNKMFDHYQEKTATIATNIVKDQEQFLETAEKTVKDVVKTVFRNLETSLDFAMARILSLLISVTMFYLAFHLNDTATAGSWLMARSLVTFYIMTVVFGAFLRVFRWIWDFHFTLKEFMKWQFITGLLTFIAILTYGIAEGLVFVFNLGLKYIQ